jgi:plasmid stability protein
MATLTIRIPDDKHSRLKQLARAKGISVNKLVEELSTIALTEFDTYNRFQALAARGDRQRGLDLLDKLDQQPPASPSL